MLHPISCAVGDGVGAGSFYHVAGSDAEACGLPLGSTLNDASGIQSWRRSRRRRQDRRRPRAQPLVLRTLMSGGVVASIGIERAPAQVRGGVGNALGGLPAR